MAFVVKSLIFRRPSIMPLRDCRMWFAAPAQFNEFFSSAGTPGLEEYLSMRRQRNLHDVSLPQQQLDEAYRTDGMIQSNQCAKLLFDIHRGPAARFAITDSDLRGVALGRIQWISVNQVRMAPPGVEPVSSYKMPI